VRLAEARAAQQQKAADALRNEAAEAAASGDDLRTMVPPCKSHLHPPIHTFRGSPTRMASYAERDNWELIRAHICRTDPRPHLPHCRPPKLNCMTQDASPRLKRSKAHLTGPGGGAAGVG
jgi:hypothetical protein